MKRMLAYVLAALLLISNSVSALAETNGVSGNVTIAVYPAEQELYEYIFSSGYFKEQYPQIHVTVTPWAESGSAEWLTTQAANNSLLEIRDTWKKKVQQCTNNLLWNKLLY